MKKAQKVADYPKFSGQQKDWKQFEKDFVATANSQNYGHVLDLEYDSPTPMALYKTTTGRPPSPVISNKTPPSDRSSPSFIPNNTVDPYHIDKAEWMTLFAPTKEKINAMRKHLRDLPSSNIKLLQTTDEQETDTSSRNNDQPINEESAADPIRDTIQQFLVRTHRQFTLTSTRLRQPLKNLRAVPYFAPGRQSCLWSFNLG